MGVDRLRAFLRRHRRIGLDTSVFIYHLQSNLKYLAYTDLIFSWLERSESTAITSTITMTELLVLPYREDNEPLANDFYGLLATHPNLDWIPPSLKIADLAARIRAHYQLKTPDALQAATTAYSDATGMITNDAVFKRVENFQTLVLGELL